VSQSRDRGDGVRGEKPADRERAQRSPKLAKALAHRPRVRRRRGRQAKFVCRVRAAGGRAVRAVWPVRRLTQRMANGAMTPRTGRQP
jgi:hypothetical protein